MLDKLDNINGVVIKPAKWIFYINGLVFFILLVIFPLFKILDKGVDYYVNSNLILIHITFFVLVIIYFVYIYTQKTVLADEGIYRQYLSLRGLKVKYLPIDEIKYWNNADLCVELISKKEKLTKIPILSYSAIDKEKFTSWLISAAIPTKGDRSI